MGYEAILWHALLLPAGFAAGIINVLAGGGSFLTLPVLIAAGLPVHVANGTNRISVVAQGIFATTTYRKSGELDAQVVKLLLPALLLGACLGAWLATQIDPKSLERVFGVLFIAMACVLVVRSRLPIKKARPPHPLRIPALFLVGLYGGFIQAGVGLWILICATALFRIPALQANAAKLALTLTFTIPALCIFWYAGLVRWVPGTILAVGTVLGTMVGVKLTLQGGEKFILPAVTLVLVVTGLKLVWF